MTKSTKHALDLIAFYLPQFHATPENDEWWGKGFTEWTNVRKAKPNFPNHLQPIEPGELGYYSLLDPKVQVAQAELAKTYGIRGFCYYAYWFDGRRMLEKPLDLMLANRDVDIDFCVCWANENWTRRWDGRDNEILIGQPHTLENDKRFIHDMLKYMQDPRYIRVNNCPLLLVYRADILAEPKATVAYWKQVVRDAGLGELNACCVEFYGVENPQDFGFDTMVEFPPHKSLLNENVHLPASTQANADFKGAVFDYVKTSDWFMRKPIAKSFTRYRGVMPRWDNTARRQDTSHIFYNSDPKYFHDWIYRVGLETLLTQRPGERLIFINAWNEWGEGCMLEPDKLYGRTYLQAVFSALLALDGKAVTIDEYWAALAKAEPFLSSQDLNVVKEIILSYERDILAILNMLKHKDKSPAEEDKLLAAYVFQTTSFGVLTRTYVDRLTDAVRRRLMG